MLPADYANAFAALRDPFWRRESESRVYRDEKSGTRARGASICDLFSSGRSSRMSLVI